MLPSLHHDWHSLLERSASEPVVVTRDRVRWLYGLFALALVVILGRAAQLELTDGVNFRRLAARPIERTIPLVAERGRILARDGTVLAQDRAATAIAVQFRYLQDPPDPAWLRRQARARLSAHDRRYPDRVAKMQTQVRQELVAMHRGLALRCGVPYADWQARAARIDRRVTELANLVNERRLARHAAQQPPTEEVTGMSSLVGGLFSPPEPLPPAPVIIAEQTAFHRLASDVPADLAAEIKARPKDFPGVQVVEHTTRDYPAGGLAAHVVGHVGRRSGIESRVRPDDSPQDVDDVVGLLGIERMLDAQLGGVPGESRQSIDHRGKVLGATVQREPAPGRDAVLTIDVELERAAEGWLDQATRRRGKGAPQEHGGAIVVLNVHSGEVLTAASAPRFDPNLLVSGDPRVEAVLADPARPLFDRTTKMAIPPGSVFKPLVALALVSEGAIDPLAALHCQGYLDDPERMRCQIFRAQGVGHGDVTLSDALAQSCNVYFFEQVAALGGPRLVEWATRFGFGQETTVELPDEAAGQLPNAADLRVERQVQSLAIGQATLTATPLQVARLYAAIANGGHLVTPRITRDRTAQSRTSRAQRASFAGGEKVPGLSPAALAAVHVGLCRVVDDPSGTAYATVRVPGLAIAGKTGTAETGGNQPDHAWFAGYAPADEPRYAFVVVLEHAGSGSESAGPLARKLVERMRELGYFGNTATADKNLPPGKG
jgi:penicillin-binding protein 2